jgi:hypothetical protein
MNYCFLISLDFFYQYGIGCIVDKDKALELYILTVNNKIEDEYLNQKFTQLLEKYNDSVSSLLIYWKIFIDIILL